MQTKASKNFYLKNLLFLKSGRTTHCRGRLGWPKLPVQRLWPFLRQHLGMQPDTITIRDIRNLTEVKKNFPFPICIWIENKSNDFSTTIQNKVNVDNANNLHHFSNSKSNMYSCTNINDKLFKDESMVIMTFFISGTASTYSPLGRRYFDPYTSDFYYRPYPYQYFR
jgi:hypothetical protein